VEIAPESEHQEVPREEAAPVKIVRALKKRCGNQCLAIGCCRQPKKQTQGNAGSWKKLATAQRDITHHAGVTRRTGCSHTGPMVEQR
jgi:hypothetical protein